MKKRKLKAIAAHFESIPLVKSSVLFAVLAQSLDAHLYTLYRDTVSFSFEQDNDVVSVECDVARLVTCLRLIIDCAHSETPVAVHLSLEDNTAVLNIQLQKEGELPKAELSSLAMLGQFRLGENDSGIYLYLQARREFVAHLFALDKINLEHIFKTIDQIFNEINSEM